MDVEDAKTRSQIKSQVHSKSAKPELVVRKYLHANGLRYRLHRRDLRKPRISFWLG